MQSSIRYFLFSVRQRRQPHLKEEDLENIVRAQKHIFRSIAIFIYKLFLQSSKIENTEQFLTMQDNLRTPFALWDHPLGYMNNLN